ncbi:MAG: hypothetical protein QOG96_627 [Pseudonocardiales bacterium]|jgi:hypothetical protein|nr:hypothetical protein [Pseudonocardiales bacterium]
MPPDQQHRSARRRRRLPSRATDWVEGTAAWLMFALGLIGAGAALEVGTAVYATVMAQVRVESAQRTPIAVTVVNDVAYPAYPGGPAPAVSTVVRWTSRNGAEHTAPMPLRGPIDAGTSVPAWIDRHDQLVTAPVTAAEALFLALVWAMTVLAGVAAALWSGWRGVTRWTLARNRDRWAQEWAAVEPLWSGRVS